MDLLERTGLNILLTEEVVEKGKPILGICLGLQLFATVGYENGEREGLGWIKGKVCRLVNTVDERVPHMGWNSLTFNRESKLMSGINSDCDYYFVHSYHFKPDTQESVIASCDYAGGFAAAIEQNNIVATQFHPEKSHNCGIKIIKNFVDNF
jgi:glutamine amidotransferase